MLDKEELKRRIALSIKAAPRGVQATIAREIGKTEQAISGWKSTGKIDKVHLPILAKATNRKLAFFLDPNISDKDSVGYEEPVNDDLWTDVVCYEHKAGLGTNCHEATEGCKTNVIKFPSQLLIEKRLNSKNLRIMYGKGDSMEPLIRDGSMILFDLADTTPRNDCIYLLLVSEVAGSEYNVKRCVIGKNKKIMFVADHVDGDHYWTKARWLGDPRHLIKVIGRVRWTSFWLP